MPSIYHPYVTRMYSYVICMLPVWHPYVTRMSSTHGWYTDAIPVTYVIRMSLVCTRMSLVSYSYIIRMWLVCPRMSPACHPCGIRMSLVFLVHTSDIRMLYGWQISSVCHSYVLVCHSYGTRMYSNVIICSYDIHMALACTCMQYVTRTWFYHEPVHKWLQLDSNPEQLSS